ncbi:MAG: glycosyl transferase family 4, partial [Gammaproteobacteria bacterium]
LWVLAVMWLTNLYNFMDGIDGLAGAQAVTAGLAGGVLLWWLNAPGLAGASLALAAASGGFLIWNCPPARIFMGDTGSGLLGFSFAVLALAGEQSRAMPAAAWLILLALFILDASYTLLARLLRGEAWYHAHRSHAYQRLVQAGLSHRRVTLWVLLINIVVLWPAAGIICAYPGLLPWVLLVVAIAGWLLWWGVRSKFSNP